MKATIEFNLDDPEDMMSHLRAVKSLDMAIVLFNLQSNFRNEIEHIVEKNKKEDISELIMDKIDELYQKHNINIDELIN